MRTGFLLAFIFLLFIYISNAQEKLIYTGLLLDSATQKPIPYAHIQLNQIVAVSNQSGRFSVRYGPNDSAAFVKFSCVGYQTKELKLTELLSSRSISLVQDSKFLPEIMVSELTAESILKKAEKKGFKNYTTPKYSASYVFNQTVFFDDADSSVAASTERGMLTNRGLDTTETYPRFVSKSRKSSTRFPELDALDNPVLRLTGQRDRFPVKAVYSFDPLRVGLLKQPHAVPMIFSRDFYEYTDINLVAVITQDGREHYLITVSPKSREALTLQQQRQLARMEENAKENVKEKIMDVAAKIGRSVLEHQLDSILSGSRNQRDLSALFLVDAKTFGIVHALIKMNTFEPTGRLYGKLHVSASYLRHGKSYYLQNLEILTTMPVMNNEGQSGLNYLLSLVISDFQTKPRSKPVFPVDEMAGSTTFSGEESVIRSQLKDVGQFIIPVRDCVSCPRNPLVAFGQKFL
jgi:hypothetical protein